MGGYIAPILLTSEFTVHCHPKKYFCVYYGRVTCSFRGVCFPRHNFCFYFFINIYSFLQFPWVNTIYFYPYVSFFNNSLIIFTTMGRQNNIINPATLAIRLAANMVAGHLLLTLLGSQGPLLGALSLAILFVGLVLLLLLEVAVACIQSYVFTILRSLCLGELISVEFNKKILS